MIEARSDIDANQLICAWSTEAEQLWGWTASQAIGMPVSELVPARNRERQRRGLHALLNSQGASADIEVTSLHREGREFRTKLALSVRRTDGVPRIVVLASGMSPSAWAKATFDATDDRFHAILDQINDGCSVTDLRGNLLFANAAHCQLYGFRQSDVLGTNFREHFATLCTSSVLAAIHDVHAKVYRTGEPVRDFEFDISIDGREMTVEMSVSIDRNAGGEAVGFIAISRDCTRRVRAEREAARARNAAEAANRSKSEFLANMSHEIRTPMNGIIGMTELALATPLTEVQRDYLQTVHRSADALLVIINDILDFSKIEAGKLNIEEIPFSLRSMLDDAVRPLAFRAHEKGLDLVVDVQPRVPDHVVGDPHRLRQVVVNLLGNAIKFTAAGEIVVRVTAAPGADGRVRLRVHVIDTGIGIPGDRQALIFQPFEQADGSTTRRFGGTGLGLTISSRLIARMGGRLWVDSEPGRGSDFQFEVELAQSAAPPLPAPHESMDGVFGAPTVADLSPTASAASLPTAARTLRVLVAEDNAVNRKVIDHLLRRRGHEPFIVPNGLEAVRAVADRSFDLVLMDLQMPEMDGFEATAAIRAMEREVGARIPIVALTAHAMEGDRQRCLDADMDGYVSKPVKAVELFEAIDRIVAAAGPDSGSAASMAWVTVPAVAAGSHGG